MKRMLALGMVLLLVGAVALSEPNPNPPAPPNGGVAPTPPPAPASAAVPPEQPVSPGTGMTVRASGDVNVRSGPGTSYSIIGTLNRGQTASCIGSTQSGSNGRVWYHINYYGGTGWVSSAYASVF